MCFKDVVKCRCLVTVSSIGSKDACSTGKAAQDPHCFPGISLAGCCFDSCTVFHPPIVLWHANTFTKTQSLSPGPETRTCTVSIERHNNPTFIWILRPDKKYQTCIYLLNFLKCGLQNREQTNVLNNSTHNPNQNLDLNPVTLHTHHIHVKTDLKKWQETRIEKPINTELWLRPSTAPPPFPSCKDLYRQGGPGRIALHMVNGNTVQTLLKDWPACLYVNSNNVVLCVLVRSPGSLVLNKRGLTLLG